MIGVRPLAMVFVFVPFLALYLFVWWRLISKTGHPGWMALLFLIPLVNVGFVIYLAFSEWPIEQELKRLQQPRN